MFQPAQLPETDEHDEGELFLVIAEQGGGETSHALNVANFWEVEGEGVEDAEEEALAATIAATEHNVARDGARNVEVDLNIVGGGEVDVFLFPVSEKL